MGFELLILITQVQDIFLSFIENKKNFITKRATKDVA